MAKVHSRSHVAVLRGRFTLLLLPPLLWKQDLQLLLLHLLSPGSLPQTQNRPLLLLHTQEPPPSSSVAPKVGDRRGHGKPTPMKEHTLRPLAGSWHQSPFPATALSPISPFPSRPKKRNQLQTPKNLSRTCTSAPSWLSSSCRISFSFSFPFRENHRPDTFLLDPRSFQTPLLPEPRQFSSPLRTGTCSRLQISHRSKKS